MKHYYLKQKVFSFRDRYKIYDEEQNLLYHVKGHYFSITHKMDFIDESNDALLYQFRRKLLSFLPTYFMYDELGDTIATVHRNWSFFTKKVSVTTKDKTYQIEGTFYAHAFDILDQGTVVASIKKRWISWGDTYEITIVDESDEAFYLALVILIDSIFHDNRSRSSHH
ncbi:MAG: hypothetical protein CVV61_06435 [Tenericutes bacterium HGW-Tenericutes-6]|nr:MAG: hypothetical protein CVV61_06435 [Tenericutes bacterium HGW-Tenericutes-6]